MISSVARCRYHVLFIFYRTELPTTSITSITSYSTYYFNMGRPSNAFIKLHFIKAQQGKSKTPRVACKHYRTTFKKDASRQEDHLLKNCVQYAAWKRAKEARTGVK